MAVILISKFLELGWKYINNDTTVEQKTELQCRQST